jgi:small subunit ribosomal protein S17
MPRRILEGTVVSDKMDKTITVLVERRYMHPIYKKYLKQTKKYAAHDENNIAREGQKVQIIECAPISKRKTWTLITEGLEVQPAAEKKASAVKPAAAKKATVKKAAGKKA